MPAAVACFMALLLGLRVGASTTPRALPGPAVGPGRPDAAAQNAACAHCHVAVAAEWRGSLHHDAYTNTSFAAALAREPLPFCRGCHAPEADPERPAPRALAQLGVGCVSCHVPDDVVLAAPRADLAQETAPHPIRRSGRFAGAGACAGCHEFAFPGAPELMQRTVAEHAASTRAGTSCADCHMPRVGVARRSHAFVASRDPGFVAQAVRVAARRDGSQVVLRLAPGAVGHAFPTGDLFRRLVVVAEVVEAGRQLRADRRVLARHFDRVRRELWDDRVGAAAFAGPEHRPSAGDPARDGDDIVVTLELGPPAYDREIRWRVQYERVAFPANDRDDAEIEASMTIAGGVLRPWTGVERQGALR